MLSQLTIPTNRIVEPALDWQRLYAIGLNHVQRLANRIWTDYNVHDPGITTLELLCYALTDLSYRSAFPVKDLLASQTKNEEEMKKQFFTPRQILPNRPLTLLDYRKLLIDLKGVKNAWLHPATLTYYAATKEGKLLRTNPGGTDVKEVNIRGLYDVTIEFMDDATSAETKARVLDAAKARLHANRNLCEDFVRFNEIATQSFLLCAELELTATADVAKVQAEIIFQVQQYLSPPVPNYALSEMLERTKADATPLTVDEIFDGPALDCGFIDDDELKRADLRTKIFLSDIISVIMDIGGVRAVREIVINPEGTSVPLAAKWIVPVAERKKALLNETRSRLVFYKRDMPVVADGRKVAAYLTKLRDDARSKVETDRADDIGIPLGTFRGPGDYYSFQNHYPALYGLTEFGLSSGADEKRRALAFQLKAYLLFFDQVMANYFAQLAHFRELLSADPDLQRTYFCQVVDSIAEYNKIYRGNPLSSLEEIIEDKGMFADRRNRFLSHLIARFAERFTDFVHVLHSAFGFSPESMLGYKCDFLNNYPVISAGRSLAYNYSLRDDVYLWDSENVSGLEKRLAKLLGLQNFARRNLSEVKYDDFAAVEPADAEFAFRIRDRATGDTLVSSAAKYATSDLAHAALTRAIFFGLLPSGYLRTETGDGKFSFDIVDDKGTPVASPRGSFDTEAQGNQAIDRLIGYLQAHYSDEALYLIEMILLRPELPLDPFLPLCPDQEDPYSYRIHVILPAYSSRFGNMDFRHFAEEVIREETPAHVLPRICWISRQDMAALEKAYRDWISVKAGANTAESTAKLQAFISILFTVRNVYPPRKLHECGAGEDQPKFLLGQTALGSLQATPENN
ncbi:MAG TPA: hypothetical protein VIS96_12355 [Terrimicrobiaceae bacterium]